MLADDTAAHRSDRVEREQRDNDADGIAHGVIIQKRSKDRVVGVEEYRQFHGQGVAPVRQGREKEVENQPDDDERRDGEKARDQVGLKIGLKMAMRRRHVGHLGPA